VVRALPVAHQFLSKPCDGDQLRHAIDRTCGLQQLLRGELIRQTAGRLDRLPSAADAYWALTRALGDPNVSLAGVAAIVERDPAMSAKVLQLVNSAGFGLPRRVTSIFEAVQFVGTNTIKGLVLTAQVFSLANRVSVAGLSVSRLQEHSLLTARVAKRLVGRRDIAEDAFAAGLLHDIGQLVLALEVPSRYAAILADARNRDLPVHEVEYGVIGVSHAEVGAYLLGVWGLPFAVVEAVAYHHRPSPVAEGDRDLLAVTHVAEALVEAGANGPTLDAAFLASGPWTGQLAAWSAMANEIMTDTGTRGSQP
jgi:HD-like signal output (HDOD) protein